MGCATSTDEEKPASEEDQKGARKDVLSEEISKKRGHHKVEIG